MTGSEEIIARLNKIEERLTLLEKKDNSSASVIESQVANPWQQKIEPRVEPVFHDKPKRQEEGGGNLLGYIGSACIILAAILLIKLSVDSGWLTPVRQCLIAVLVAFTLIVLPFFIKLKDKAYVSFLPAIGVVVLHLTTYGSVFYYHLFNPALGIVFISLIGIFSLWLLTMLKEDTYAILAIFGTYLGILFFHNSFKYISVVVFYLLVWDVIFSLFAIKLKRRSIIAISSNLAFILVAFMGVLSNQNADLNYKILLIQALQFVVFASAVIIFSITNKMKLTAKEAWSFFPVIILFYGQQYFFLSKISQNAATLLALAFAFILLAAYHFTKKNMEDEELDSAGMVYSVFSIVIAHSIFIVELNDLSRIIFSFLVIFLLWLFRARASNDRNLKGPLIVGLLIMFYSYMLVLTNVAHINFGLILLFGTIYGAIALYAFSEEIEDVKSIILLYLGHLQILGVLFRLRNVLESFLTPLWMVYAFAILYWAYKREDKNLAQSAVILIITGLVHFFFSDFISLDGAQRTLSLFISGGLIFSGGYFYRNIAKQ